MPSYLFVQETVAGKDVLRRVAADIKLFFATPQRRFSSRFSYKSKSRSDIPDRLGLCYDHLDPPSGDVG